MRKKILIIQVIFIFLITVSLTSLVSGQKDEKKAGKKLNVLEFEDLQSFKSVSGIISPDGETILYTVLTINKKKNETHSLAWRIPFNGGEPVQMTTEPTKDRSFQWRPDGKRFSFLREIKNPTFT